MLDTAFAKHNYSQKWHHFDDAYVTEVPEEAVVVRKPTAFAGRRGGAADVTPAFLPMCCAVRRRPRTFCTTCGANRRARLCKAANLIV